MTKTKVLYRIGHGAYNDQSANYLAIFKTREAARKNLIKRGVHPFDARMVLNLRRIRPMLSYKVHMARIVLGGYGDTLKDYYRTVRTENDLWAIEVRIEPR